MTMFDDKGMFTLVFLLRLKSQTYNLIKFFVSMVNTQLKSKVKCISFENGNEFLLKEFYNKAYIIHQAFSVVLSTK